MGDANKVNDYIFWVLVLYIDIYGVIYVKDIFLKEPNYSFEKLDLGDHIIIISDSEEEELSTVISFINIRLNKNEKCIYIAKQNRKDRVLKEVKAQIDSAKEYLKNGQLIILDSKDTYGNHSEFDPDKIIEMLIYECQKALKEGYNGLTITGEISRALKYKNGREKIIEYEWKLNEKLFNNYPVIGLCRYDLNIFDYNLIKTAIELHPYLIYKNKVHENPYYISYKGFKDNNVSKHRVQTWLKNIDKYTKTKSKFKEDIEKGREKYEYLFNKISDAIFVHEFKNGKMGKFIQVNDKACDLLGYSRDELINMSPYDISYRLVNKNIEYELVKMLADEEVQFEDVHIKKSGDTVPVEVKVHFFERDGKKYFLAISRDATKRKMTERELRLSNQKLNIHNRRIDKLNKEIKESYVELKKLTNNLEEIINLISSMTEMKKEEEYLSIILKASLNIISEADYGKIFVYKDNKFEIVDAIGHDIELLRDLNIEVYNDKNMNDKAKEVDNCSIISLKQSSKDTINKLRNALNPIRKTLYIDLIFDKEVLGRISLDISMDNNEEFSQNSKILLESLGKLASSFLAIQRYYKLQYNFTEKIIIAITHLLEIHDPYTKGHSKNVGYIAKKIAQNMNLDTEYVDKAYWAGLVHDIGKIVIPHDILNKNHQLTEEEYEIIKKHPLWGYTALASSSELKDIASYILYHHERWDGRGYPKGIKKDNIPLISQILAVADAWDAMRSKRAYRNPMTKAEAINELVKNKGSQFSPFIVDSFLNIIDSVN